jgi:5'-nucleotidase
MRILVSNDDGIYSPGIAALARSAAKLGDVRVVAPDVEQSSAGHAITASRPVPWHSGTLAAAKQAVLLGTRGIALSAPVDDETSDFSVLEPWIARALETVLADDDPKLVNVNFPSEPRGLRWTSQAVDQYNGKIVPDTDPMGRVHFWFTVVPLEKHREGTDLWAVDQGYVSLTPLRLDLTDYEELERVADTIPEQLEGSADRQ